MLVEEKVIIADRLVECFWSGLESGEITSPEDTVDFIRNTPCVDAVILPVNIGDRLVKITDNREVSVEVISIAFLMSKTVTRLCIHVQNQRGAVFEILPDEIGKLWIPCVEV